MCYGSADNDIFACDIPGISRMLTVLSSYNTSDSNECLASPLSLVNARSHNIEY